MTKAEIYNEAIAAVILVDGLDMCERVEILEELITQKHFVVFADAQKSDCSNAV